MIDKPKVLVVLGATGTGKTALSIFLSRCFRGEVVNEDSRQVYRYMDVGTAKPTQEERREVPHHGFDVVLPDEAWTLANQQRLTYQVVDAIHRRGNLPVLVGGTGQYLRAVTEGWTVPEVEPQPELRAELEAEARRRGASDLHERLRGVDPTAADRIGPGDVRRIVRALEVYEVTRQPISALQESYTPPYAFLQIGLAVPRPVLYERLDRRVEAQLEGGLLAEIDRLLSRGYGWSLPAMHSVGYREFRPYFEGTATLEDCVQRVKYDTHALVRRQDIWFRRFEDVHWIDASGPGAAERAECLVGDWLER